jgi:catalase
MGRIHSYVDTQISRLGGPNFHEIPINAPVAQVHNNQRDGMHRQAIHRGRVSYEPNSLGGGCPFQAGAAGFVSFPERIEPEAHKVRGKAERFADHYTQATLFWNSQTAVEKTHIVNAFRFELSKVQTPAVRERMVSGLMNVDSKLAQAVGSGLGMRKLPAPMPKVLETEVKPEVSKSPALSLLARPGDGSVRARRVALLVADGVEGGVLKIIADRLTAAGAVPRFVGARLGTTEPASGDPIEVDATIESIPSVLWDGVVLPDGTDAVHALAADGRAREFLKDQYRHCKPILAPGAASELLERTGVPQNLPSGEPDPGLVLGRSDDGESLAEAFINALGKHRHFDREGDPPLV